MTSSVLTFESPKVNDMLLASILKFVDVFVGTVSYSKLIAFKQELSLTVALVL